MANRWAYLSAYLVIQNYNLPSRYFKWSTRNYKFIEPIRYRNIIVYVGGEFTRDLNLVRSPLVTTPR